MSRVCSVCGKGPGVGNKVSHANNKSRRRFMANVQKIRVFDEGGVRRKYVCTRCIRSGFVKKAPVKSFGNIE